MKIYIWTIANQSLFSFHAIITSQQFKKLPYFDTFLAFLDQLCNCDFVAFREKFLHKLFNLFVDDLVGDAEDLEAGADWWVDQKLQFYQLQTLDLVEVEDIEEDCVSDELHLILSYILVSEKMAIPEKSSRESMSPLLSVSQTTKEDSPVSKMC